MYSSVRTYEVSIRNKETGEVRTALVGATCDWEAMIDYINYNKSYDKDKEEVVSAKALPMRRFRSF